MVATSRCLVWPSRCLVFLLCSASVHGLHVSSYQLLRGDAVPTAADRQLRRECEQALRSDSSEDAQQLALGALAARPLAVEVARGDQGRRLRRFWLPRGLSASVEELEVEARRQSRKLRPRGFGQLALRRPPSAPEHPSGYPKPRPASFYQPVVSGEFSC